VVSPNSSPDLEKSLPIIWERAVLKNQRDLTPIEAFEAAFPHIPFTQLTQKHLGFVCYGNDLGVTKYSGDGHCECPDCLRERGIIPASYDPDRAKQVLVSLKADELKREAIFPEPESWPRFWKQLAQWIKNRAQGATLVIAAVTQQGKLLCHKGTLNFCVREQCLDWKKTVAACQPAVE
jgi:hypothetical protein